MTIPMLIHQTAKTADLPAECKSYQQQLLALHPGWKYHLWTDEDNLNFVKREFPDFSGTFTALPKAIMRADVIRYLLMYRLGGLYLDTDYEMLKPFDLLHHEAVLPWESSRKPVPGGDLLCNCIFASAPGHPIFKMMIDDLKANPPLSDKADVIEATGPKFVTRIVRMAAGQNFPVYLAPKELFSPLTPRNHREYREILRQGVAYGIHHCYGSWREWTLLQRAKMQVGSLYRRVT
jgi:mannosyltransferase OCH1-like enzyme